MDLALGTRGRFRWLLIVLVVALVFGAAAALLSGPASPFTPAGSGPGTSVSFQTISLIFGWTVLALCAVQIGLHLYRRRTEGSMSIPNRFIVSFLVAVLIAIAFILIVRAGIVGHGNPFLTGPPGGNNSSTGLPPATSNNSTLPPLGYVPLGGFNVPGWILFVALVLVAVVAVAIAVPVIASLRDRASPLSDLSAKERARRDLSEAIRALDAQEAPDPREVIIALYARLLGRIGTSLDGLEAMAPREIESECVHRLRVRPATARELTRLFEEARYSRHPLGQDIGVRARSVFQQAIADLDHPSGLT